VSKLDRRPTVAYQGWITATDPVHEERAGDSPDLEAYLNGKLREQGKFAQGCLVRHPSSPRIARFSVVGVFVDGCILRCGVIGVESV
jgi:hypothetical protein